VNKKRKEIEGLVEAMINTPIRPGKIRSNRLYIVVRDDGWWEPMMHVKKSLEGVIGYVSRNYGTGGGYSIHELKLSNETIIYRKADK
jgi:hypothetical protein